MSADLSALLGYPAAALTTAAFVPQAWKSWRTRDVSGISLPMYALFTLGVALWCAYGFAIGSLPVIVANGITLVLASVVLGLKMERLTVTGGGAMLDQVRPRAEFAAAAGWRALRIGHAPAV